MCGIAGGWSRGALGRSFNDRFLAGLEKIRHRGPDDLGVSHWDVAGNEGRVDLGSTRLAILDLSPAGQMPMSTPDGRLEITYNGEITNFVEVRQDLSGLGYEFRSHADTEVFLQAWAAWGADSLDRFEGMYACAILDKRDRTLTLVRDAFGIKPLFYSYRAGESLIFCSELPALLAVRNEQPRLSWQAAIDYLQFGSYDNLENTFVDGVTQLRPGHLVTLDLSTGLLDVSRRYWQPSVDTDWSITFDQAADAVRELFLESVRHNLRSDVPVGVALSGGIDSSAIACSIRHLEPDYQIESFSFISPGFHESEDEWIDRVVAATGARSYTTSSTGDELLRDLDGVIRAQGEPFGSTSIYAQYRVFQKVREEGVVVTLNGQGADEIFAGYTGFPGYRIHGLIETGKWREASQFATAWSQWPGRSKQVAIWDAVSHLMPTQIARAMESTRGGRSPVVDYRKLRERGIRTGLPRLEPQRGVRGKRLKDQLRSQLMVRGLPSLLRHGDRNSMRFLVESRVPFLDRGLVNLALSPPEHYLVGADGTSKNIFRRAMRGIVPDAVLDRRDKVGFSTPQQTWLRELNESSAGARRRDGSQIGFFLPGAIGWDGPETRSEDELGLGAGSHWRLLNLRRWIDIFEVDAS